jgi:hypothetical protein
MKSSVRTYEALVMRVEEWAQVVVTFNFRLKYLFIHSNL